MVEILFHSPFLNKPEVWCMWFFWNAFSWLHSSNTNLSKNKHKWFLNTVNSISWCMAVRSLSEFRCSRTPHEMNSIAHFTQHHPAHTRRTLQGKGRSTREAAKKWSFSRGFQQRAWLILSAICGKPEGTLGGTTPQTWVLPTQLLSVTCAVSKGADYPTETWTIPFKALVLEQWKFSHFTPLMGIYRSISHLAVHSWRSFCLSLRRSRKQLMVSFLCSSICCSFLTSERTRLVLKGGNT